MAQSSYLTPIEAYVLFGPLDKYIGSEPLLSITIGMTLATNNSLTSLLCCANMGEIAGLEFGRGEFEAWLNL